MACRAISRFQLLGTETLKCIHSTAGTFTITFDAGYYFHAGDNSVVAGALDFLKAAKDKLDAASGLNWTVHIYDVTFPFTGYADGRMAWIPGAGTFQFDFSPATSIDPRVLGVPSGTTLHPASPAASFASPHVHRYGWYPQLEAASITPYPVPDVEADLSSGRYLGVVDYGEFEHFDCLIDNVGAPLVRPDAANNAVLAAAYLLSTGDENSAFARWVVDTWRNGERWRFYEVATDYGVDDFLGPYQWHPDDPLVHDPLAGPSFPEDDAAELWTIVIPGHSLPSGA